jgi:hypothetical protein
MHLPFGKRQASESRAPDSVRQTVDVWLLVVMMQLSVSGLFLILGRKTKKRRMFKRQLWCYWDIRMAFLSLTSIGTEMAVTY